MHTTGGRLPSRWCGVIVPASSRNSNTNSSRHGPLCRRRRMCAVCFSSSSDDLYGVLSIAATASQAEIKAAYRRLAHDLHPDKHHATKHKHQAAVMAEAFLQVKLAYEVLSDPQQRREYDQARAAAAAAGAARGGQQQGPASPAQACSPYYNGWMDAYGTANNPADNSSSSQGVWSSGHQDEEAAAAADNYQAMQQAAAATAAAGASHSGLSDFADPLAAALGSSGDDDSSRTGTEGQQQQTPAAVRAALLQEHGLALEQFGSLQDAVAALSERDQQQTVVGLAEGDYDNTWTL